MSGANVLKAILRDRVGKTSKKLAPENLIPAVLYGPGRDSLSLAIDRHEFEQFITRHSVGATIVDLAIEGESKPVSAMIRELQHSAVKGTILHIDFLEVAMNKPVTTVVPLRLVNDPAGVRAGGVLTINVHEVNIEAKPADLPEAIEVDVEALEIGDSITLGDVTPPKGVTVLDDPEAVVASVQAPRLEEAEEEGALEEGAEPELVGKGDASDEE